MRVVPAQAFVDAQRVMRVVGAVVAGEDRRAVDRGDDARRAVTYGWGMVPVTVGLGDTAWTTSLWPKDGGYVVPLKAAVRRAEGVELGDVVTLRLTVAL